MIISWRGSTVYAGTTFTSLSNPLVFYKINFKRFTAPTVVHDYNAITGGNKLSPQRLLNAPTNLYNYNPLPPTPSTEFQCLMEIGVSLVVDSGALNRRAELDTTISLIVNVAGVSPFTCALDVGVHLIVTPSSDFNREDCFTDADLDVIAEPIRINRVF